MIITNPPTQRDQFKCLLNEHRHKIIFVKFYADWCAPCEECQPAILEMFHRLNITNKLLIMVNFDKCRDVVRYYRVKSIPTLISFKDAEPHNIIVGVDQRKLQFIFSNL